MKTKRIKNITNIYLDIDGVLLINESNLSNNANAFLEYVLNNYPDNTYWLTTHCQGDASLPIKRFGHLFDEKVVELMQAIKPTHWTVSKTEAIDFSHPFLWFDDDLFDEEKEELIKHGALDNYIRVDLYKNPDQLNDFLQSFPLPKSTDQF